MEIPSDLRKEISEFLPRKDLIQIKNIFPKNRHIKQIEKEREMLKDIDFLIRCGMFYSAYEICKDWDILISNILDSVEYGMEALVELLEEIYNEGSNLKEDTIDKIPPETLLYLSKSTLVGILKEELVISLDGITNRKDIVELFKEDIFIQHLSIMLDKLKEKKERSEIFRYFEEEVRERRGKRIAEILFYSEFEPFELLDTLTIVNDKKYFLDMVSIFGGSGYIYDMLVGQFEGKFKIY